MLPYYGKMGLCTLIESTALLDNYCLYGLKLQSYGKEVVALGMRAMAVSQCPYSLYNDVSYRGIDFHKEVAVV